MSELEFRYRSALRWYPKNWRTANADAVLGTLLDVAEEENRTEPTRVELVNLHINGIAVRLGFVGRLLSRSAREHASILTLGLGTSISAAGILFGAWTYQFADRHYQQVFSFSALLQNLGAGQGVYLFWIVGFVAAVVGLRRIAVTLLLTSIPVSIAWTAIALAFRNYGHPSDVSLGFLDLLAIVTTAGLTQHTARYRKRVAVTALAFGALLAGSFVLRGYGGGYWGNGARYVDYFWSALAVWLVFVGIPLALVVVIVYSRLQQRDRAVAVLFASSPLLPLGLMAFGWQLGAPNIAEVLIAVILGVALAVGVLRVFGLRIRITRV